MINYLKSTAGAHKQCSLGVIVSVGAPTQKLLALLVFFFLFLFYLYFLEEMKNPSRNIPLTVMTAVPAVIVFYLLVNISYLTVLTPKEIVSSGMSLIFLLKRCHPLADPFYINVLGYLCSPNFTVRKGSVGFSLSFNSHLILLQGKVGLNSDR